MKPVILTMTDSEALDVRMALNMASIHWGDKATEARKAGKAQEAQSCEAIRAEYGALWDRLFKAEHGHAFDYQGDDWRNDVIAAREATADAMFASEARE
jgi:hypothetical protein